MDQEKNIPLPENKQLSQEELDELLVKTDSESNFRKDSGWKNI